MFNVPLHSRSAIEAHRTRWRVESAQLPYTKGIANLYEWRGDSNDIRETKQTINYKQKTI